MPQTLNSVLRFVLELAARVALATWGAWIGSGPIASVLLARALPFAAGVLWGLYVAPRRRIDAPLPLRLAVELLVFGTAVIGLAVMGLETLALVLGALVVVSSSLHLRWHQDAAVRAAIVTSAPSRGSGNDPGPTTLVR